MHLTLPDINTSTDAATDTATAGSSVSPTRVLLVPGFVVDTYSEIERSYVELSKDAGDGLEIIWIVPEINWRHNAFAHTESRTTLTQAVVVPHLLKQRTPFIVANIRKYDVIANYFLFRKIFREYKIDAVYTHFGYERFWAALFGRLFGKTVIWNEHWHSLGRRFRRFKRVFYRLFVDEFISISTFITGTLSAGSRVHTIPNAIRANTQPTPDSTTLRNLRARLGVDDRVFVVLMVAAFRSEKRHDLALAICQHLLNFRKDVQFIFLGKGPLRTSFLAECDRRNLTGHVLAPGYVANVDDYYAVADMCWLTSELEPFGYVVLEAMRHGKPIVCSATGGPAEVIRSGVTGILVHDQDVHGFVAQILSLLADTSYRKRIGEQARAAVMADFNREDWIKTVRKRLREIVARNVRSRAPAGR